MKSIQALIFDMDGTMIDSISTHLSAWSAFAQLHKIRLQDDFMLRVAGKSDSAVISDLYQPPLTEQQAQALNLEKQRLYDNLTRPKAIDGIEDFIAKIAQLQLPWGIGSGASRAGIATALDSLALVQAPQSIVCADDNLPSKPNPDIFLAVAEQLQTAPEHCLVFEDSAAGIEAARHAGMAVIAVRPAASIQAIEMPHVFYQISSYTELLANNFLENLPNV